MLARILILATLICVPLRAQALEFVKCPRFAESFSAIEPISDERIIGIFAEVHARTGFTKQKFALCTSTEFNPGMIALSDDDLEIAIILPRNVALFSDKVIRGLMGHELGHVPRLYQSRSQQLEVEVDSVAVQWVGKESVVLALHMMVRNIKRLPWWLRDIGELSLKDRLKALEFGPEPNLLFAKIGRNPW